MGDYFHDFFDLLLISLFKLHNIESVILEWTHWIDVCQNDGNLLASGGNDNNIKIFDKRESKIIKTFDDIHSGNNLDVLNFIPSAEFVRWSPSGDKLASASDDTTVKLLDFKTGKVLYTGNTSDGSKLFLPKYMIVIQKLYRRSLFSEFHLDKNETKRTQRARILSRMSTK